MTIRHIKIFMAVCKNGYNTTKAAKALNMTQPAVSLAVKELEQYYDVMLFDRINGRLSITESGNRFLKYCVSISDLFDDMELSLKTKKGFETVRVGASYTPGSCLLTDYVKSFREIYPNVKIKACVVPYYQLENKLLANEIDFAIIEGKVKDPSLIAVPYMDDRLAVVFSSQYGFKHGETISAEAFSSQDLYLREKGSSTRDIFDTACEKIGLNIEPSGESCSTTAIVNAVSGGLGAAVLPYKLVREQIKSGKLIEVRVEGLDLKRELSIATHKSKELYGCTKKFAEHCINYNN